MKKWNKLWVLLAILAFAAMLPMAAFADNAKNQTNPKGEQTDKSDKINAKDADEEVDVDVEELDSDVDGDQDEIDKENGKNKEKAWKQVKEALQQEKDDIKLLKDLVEVEMTELEAQLKAAEISGDTVLIESLTAKIAELTVQKDTYKAEIKQRIVQMQEIMKEKYTQEELDQLEQISQELGTVSGIKVLPVTNIFVKNKDVKFDTPPVIKEGRTLIPLRAISEATGAEVAWNSETKTITITKEDKEIIVQIDENIITVNGTELALDVPAQLMNSRTVVPLRFIVENLDLQVNWDGETETIEIEEDTETEDITETE